MILDNDYSFFVISGFLILLLLLLNADADADDGNDINKLRDIEHSTH